MAIVNSVATYSGQGYELFQRLTVAITVAASPQTVAVPSSGSFSPALTRGLWRCKFYNTTSAITITSVQLAATDGTNTVTLDNVVPTASLSITATAYLDIMGDFLVDTSAAGGGATGTLIFGGATVINFVVVSATSSGACSGDFEIAGAP